MLPDLLRAFCGRGEVPECCDEFELTLRAFSGRSIDLYIVGLIGNLKLGERVVN